MSRDKGIIAEQKASTFLQTQGLELITKNFTGGGGEIDLVMQDAQYLVFVEVKSRKSACYGLGFETVTLRKQQRLIKAASAYLVAHKKYDKMACRFDVISIDGDEIEWIKNAFLSEF